MHTSYYSYTAATHFGSRFENQDNLRLDTTLPYWTEEANQSFSGQDTADTLRVYAVCDGIGGEAMGDLAAMNALDAIEQYLHTTPPAATDDLKSIAYALAQAAQDQVIRFYQRRYRRGGCTLVMVVLRGAEYALLNIGDSPAFHYKKESDALIELSLRHNLATYKMQNQLPVIAADASTLLCYLGAEDTADAMAHIASGTLEEGDKLLLCSDGITNAFSRTPLQDALRSDCTGDVLVEQAAQAIYADNCTAILLSYHTQSDLEGGSHGPTAEQSDGQPTL